MQYLSLPVPVARFFKRLINVISSLTISNQYLLLQKVDPKLVESEKDGANDVASHASYIKFMDSVRLGTAIFQNRGEFIHQTHLRSY